MHICQWGNYGLDRREVRFALPSLDLSVCCLCFHAIECYTPYLIVHFIIISLDLGSGTGLSQESYSCLSGCATADSYK